MSKQAPSVAEYDVAVVGGGISGCAAAFYLADAGQRVVLVDQFDLNTQGSGRNAGSLHGQLQFEPYRTNGPQWSHDYIPALRFLVDSLAVWDTLDGELDADLEVSRHGGLLVAETDEQAAQVADKVALENVHGFDSEFVTGAQLRGIAPYLSERMIAAEYCPVEGKANPLLAAPAYARAARRKGTTVLLRTVVLTVDALDGGGFSLQTSGPTLRCGKVVLAAGATLPRLTKPLGLDLPITDEPVQVHATESVAPVVGHLVYFAGGRLTLKQARTGTLLIGGGWPAEVDDRTGHPTVNTDSMRRNLRVARHVAPWIGTVRVIRAWAGVGNATPDLRPLVGEVPQAPGAFVGMFPHMGLTAGPLMGQTLAALVLDKSPGRDLEPFAVDRFSASSTTG